MSASIIVVSGPGEGDYYPLADKPVIVGRDEKCEIQMLDDLVSRRHLQIDYRPQQRCWEAMDLKSANGVFINGRQITSATRLADGDMIELGNSKLMFALKEFPDRKSARDYYKLAGERGKSTLLR